MAQTWWITALGAMLGTAAASWSRRASPHPGKKWPVTVAALVILLGAAGIFVVFVTSREQGTGKSPLAGGKRPQQVGFSRIEIRSVVYTSGQVRVEGNTDLPDDAIVSVDFNIVGPPDSEADDAVSMNVEVHGGAFTALIEPPRTPAFARGPYVVDVLFSPRAQRGEVLRRVGANGERLEGVHVRETFGFRVLEVSKQVELKISP